MEWILCSEALPKEHEDVLVTISSNKESYVSIGNYYKLDGVYWSENEGGLVDVVAWMPLPKPYGEREGE